MTDIEGNTEITGPAQLDASGVRYCSPRANNIGSRSKRTDLASGHEGPPGPGGAPDRDDNLDRG